MAIDAENKMKKSLNIQRRPTLVGIIVFDFLRHGKLQFFFFICIVATAISVMISAHNTRLLRTQREHLMIEQVLLDNEWRNLILEENMLSDLRRIERIATEILQMQHVDQSRENVLIQ